MTWEDEAVNWINWARTPGHDVFPLYAPSFFDKIVSPPQGLTLEIGCGEGRVARELASRGHNVVAVDASSTLVRSARDADARSRYLLADATALPFADAMFRTVVAYNSLQTMAELSDMADAVREAGRVLRPSGRFCVCIAHPMTDLDHIKAAAAGGDATGSYFEPLRVNQTVARNGLQMTFHGWTYTLQDYARAFEDAGFLIERLREPVPIADQATQRGDPEGSPLFLFIRAVRSAR